MPDHRGELVVHLFDRRVKAIAICGLDDERLNPLGALRVAEDGHVLAPEFSGEDEVPRTASSSTSRAVTALPRTCPAPKKVMLPRKTCVGAHALRRL
jgi:hypothetical protein